MPSKFAYGTILRWLNFHYAPCPATTKRIGFFNKLFVAGKAMEIIMNIQQVQQFKKGSMEMVLLSIISAHETYGYEIINTLNKHGGRVYGCARIGSIYPVLYRLEENGLIKHRIAPSPANGGEKKYYSITEKGEKELLGLCMFWDEYVTEVNSLTVKYHKNDG